MSGDFRWSEDPPNDNPDDEPPRSLDAYSQWFFGHGKDFEFSAEEAKEHEKDFDYYAVIVSWTDRVRPKPPTDSITPFTGLTTLTFRPDDVHKTTIIFGFQPSSKLLALKEWVESIEGPVTARWEGAQSRDETFSEVMALRTPLRSRSVPCETASIVPQDWQSPAGADPDKVVVVAAIDDGINFAHERFRLDDGKSRVDFAWHQDGIVQNGTRVPFGREWTRGEIDAAIAAAKDDEDCLLETLGLVDFSRFGLSPVARRVTHGTHVLDLAAGEDPYYGNADDLVNQRIIAVQIPSLVTEETSGALLGLFLLSAVQYVLERARAISNSLGIAVPVVINFSYAVSGGPHNGRHFIERAFKALIEDHRCRLAGSGISGANAAVVEVVVPTGNQHLARCHAASRKTSVDGGKATLSLDWQVPAGDRSPNYLEFWLPHAARSLTLRITCPHDGRSVCVPLARGVDRVLWDESLPEDIRQSSVVAWVNYTIWMPHPFSFERQRILIALAPTEIVHADRMPAPAGRWQVSLEASLPCGERIEAWIQRDTAPLGYRLRGHQSYFDDEEYVRFDAFGDFEDEDNDCGTVRRLGALSGAATGDDCVVVGGYRYRHGVAAFYSAGSSNGMRCPDAMAASDTSRHLVGVMAAGSRSGTRVAINGTSVAAPQVARLLARHLADLSCQERETFSGRRMVQALACENEDRVPYEGKAPDFRRGGAGRLPVLADHCYSIQRE